MDSTFCTTANPAAISNTLKVGEDVLGVVGMPMIVPSGFNIRPLGKASEPVARLHVYVPGPVPPDADNAALYGWSTTPTGSGNVALSVSIVSVAFALRVRDFVVATPLLSCTR